MGVRIVGTYRSAKKATLKRGTQLEYFKKRESRWIFGNQKTERQRRGGRRASVDERVLLHGGGGGCAAVRRLLIPHVCE